MMRIDTTSDLLFSLSIQKVFCPKKVLKLFGSIFGATIRQIFCPNKSGAVWEKSHSFKNRTERCFCDYVVQI